MYIKITFKLLLLASLLATTGCIKQKNCDCSMSGAFVYLKAPYKTWITCSNEKQEIVAHFFENNFLDESPVRIVGNIPKKFQSYDTMSISICCEKFCAGNIEFGHGYPVYKLKCIETED